MEPIQDLPLGTSPLTTPDIELDQAGNVWIAAENAPALMHFEQDTGRRTIRWSDLLGARDLVPRAGGGMVVLGRSEDSNNAVLAYGAAVEPELALDLDVGVRGLVPMDGFERVGLALEDGELLVLDAQDLSEAARCPTALSRPWHGAQLDDGTVVLSSEGAIGTACVGEPQAWVVGEENMEVISLGDRALVLDRIGAEAGFDPNLGIGRLVDRDGVIATFPTAKNTGFGALDADTGLVWVNSEGSAELLRLDPELGVFVDSVKVGVFLDGLTADPVDGGVLYATGRLSDTIARIEDGLPVADCGAIHWPYSPVVDLRRDLLWVLSQTESTLHGLDRASLTPQRNLDPGLGSNTLLTFGTVTIHPRRGTLFFAESQRDVLLELDPDSGTELARWDLGGPPLEDRDEVGELAVRVSAETGFLYLARSNDVRVQRVDPDEREVETVFLPSDVAAAMKAGHRTDFLRIFPDEGLLFIGGKALRLDDLSRWEERDLPVTRVAGRAPEHGDEWIAVDDQRRHIVRIDDEGELLGRQGFARHELYATVFEVSAERRLVTMTRASQGFVCSFPTGNLR